MIVKILSLLAKYLWIKELGLLNGIALIITLYVHEYGHYIKAKELNYNPKTPRFIPFLGAYVKTDMVNNSIHQFQISFFGPLIGGIFGLICFYLDLIFDSKFIHQLAVYSLILNLSNLAPISILDGGRIIKSFSLNILFIIFNLLIIIFSLIYAKYYLIILGLLGLVSSYLTKDDKLTQMSKENKKKYLFQYLIFAGILTIHTYLLLK